jgi:EAL domain-containing protein (putative c-di-GMP-specific phosphodiesterase class I)
MLAPDGELIAPDAFLPAAQRFGFMPSIDRWVIA